MRLGLLSDIHGIDTRIGDDRLGGILAGCNADLVIGGHTHDVTDRPTDGSARCGPSTSAA